jgi:predicted transporter
MIPRGNIRNDANVTPLFIGILIGVFIAGIISGCCICFQALTYYKIWAEQ